MKSKYVGTLKNLPKLKRTGHNTRTKLTPRNHIYKVTIDGYDYFKIQLHRSNLNVSNYFKLKREAKAFLKIMKSEGKWLSKKEKL